MPHLTLELTANIPAPDFDDVFAKLHGVLAAEGVPLGNCKSRAVVRDQFWIADGGSRHAFVHLDVRFVEGRAEDARHRIGKGMLRVLTGAVSQHEALDVQVTVHLTEMAREAYFKHPAGTLGGQR